MKLKTIEIEGKHYAEIEEDKPIVIDDDGKEIRFDILHTRSTISRLNAEAKASRERYEESEAKLKAFEGIDDADAARQALETIKNIKDGELIAAGKVEEIKAAAKKAADDQVSAAIKQHADKLKSAEKERDRYREDLYSEKIGGSFSRSKFIGEKAVIPADIMQAKFGNAFKIENGKTIAYDETGQPIYSRERAGENADFEEALQILVDRYPYRDQILKGTGSTGSGARPGVNDVGKRIVNRSVFDKMPPTQQREAALNYEIVDD
jgi:flagellar biosynthesis chaperone FliJ